MLKRTTLKICILRKLQTNQPKFYVDFRTVWVEFSRENYGKPGTQDDIPRLGLLYVFFLISTELMGLFFLSVYVDMN